jgi:hypothetical protein
MIFVGEVHTGLLRNSSAVDSRTAVSLMGLKAGAPVRHRERPIRFAASPEILTGLDCPLLTSPEIRAVGTASSHAVLTGGQVLQCSTSVHVVQSDAGRRLGWAHYMSCPGTVEAINRLDPGRFADGFLATAGVGSTMDLSAVNGHMHARLQSSEALDGTVAFRVPPLRLRWVAQPAVGRVGVDLSIGRDGVRRLILRQRQIDRAAISTLAEDIALHDWLLNSVQRLLDGSRIGGASLPDVVRRLTPAVNYLLHLWMPGARLDDELRPLWKSLEERSGFSRLWRVSIDRIRDQLFLAAASRPLDPTPSNTA